MGPEAWFCGPQVFINGPVALSLSELRGLGCRVEAVRGSGSWAPPRVCAEPSARGVGQYLLDSVRGRPELCAGRCLLPCSHPSPPPSEQSALPH